jgi:solute carrier family 35 protein F1/2
MANYAPTVQIPGEEMTVMPEMSRNLNEVPMYVDGADDKKQPFDGLDSNAATGPGKDGDDRFHPVHLGGHSSPSSNEASLDDKAADVAEFKKKLPAVDFKNGPGPFFTSLGRRIRAAATPRLLLCILIGQILSLCITTTSTVTTELGIGGWSLPATQVCSSCRTLIEVGTYILTFPPLSFLM